MTEVPELHGSRVLLRPWRLDDVSFVVAVSDDPLVPPISEIPAHCDAEAARWFIDAQRRRAEEGRGWAWALVPEGHGLPAGYIGALWVSRPAGRASIGYWTAAGSRRSGLTSDGVRLAADWLMRAGAVERLEAYIEPHNAASMRVAEKAGFEREGLMRSFAPIGGRRRDTYLYARIRPRPDPVPGA